MPDDLKALPLVRNVFRETLRLFPPVGFLARQGSVVDALYLAPAGRCQGYGLALPASHPLAARTSIAAHELADNVMLVRRHCELLTATSQHFTARGVRPFFAARSRNDDRILALVAAGVGVTVMPDCFTAPGVARGSRPGGRQRKEAGITGVMQA